MDRKSAFARKLAASLLSMMLVMSNTNAAPFVNIIAEEPGPTTTEPVPSEQPKQETTTQENPTSITEEPPATSTPEEGKEEKTIPAGGYSY